MSTRYVSRAAQEAERALCDIQSRLEGNQYCADCGTTRPEFINITIGTFICDLCAEIHRSSSNRQIKDMYAGNLTMEDVRRMDTVGNDVANRKFLATWNPREVPEPDRRNKDSLHEFLWLKYEGSFKKAPQPTPPPQRQQPEPDRYYDSRRDDRSRESDNIYRREQRLFRDPQPQQDRSRNYWSSKFGEAARAPQPPPPAPPSYRRDDYYRREGPAQPYSDRYRSSAPSERFRPPEPAPPSRYDVARSAKSRYQDPREYDDYAPRGGYERDRRYAPDLPPRYEGPDDEEFSDSEPEVSRSARKMKSSKSRRQTKTSSVNRDDDDYYYDDVDGGDDVGSERRSRKSQSSKSKKSSKDPRKSSSRSKRRADSEDESEGTESRSTESEEEYEREIEKKKSRRNGKSERRSEREVDSVKSLDGDAVPPAPARQNSKGEFDLMSDWMGDSKDTEGSQGVPPVVGTGIPNPSPVPAAMQQAYQTAQMPMMPQVPLSMYNSVMPMPSGGFMPMMPPGFVPGMPMAGMAGMAGMPGMPGMPGIPGMPPVMPSAMSGMPAAAGVNTAGIPGLVNGMQNMGLGQQTPVSAGQATTPPPPPPMGVPAGPPPGPPPEPPQQ